MITQEQVTALTAQAARSATYASRDENGALLPDWQENVSGVDVYIGAELATRGVGVYGQSPSSLILTGYLKPATLNLIVSPDMTAQVLNTPAVWTGQYGVESLVDYLDSAILQNISQIALMVGSYQGLIDTGYLTGDESTRFQVALIQPASKYGVDAVIDWIEGRQTTELTTQIEIVARQAQYAIDFIATYRGQLNVGPEIPGFINTVQRDEIDFVINEIIGNPKIPPLEYADIVANLVATAGVGAGAPTDEEGIFRFAPGAPRS